MTVAELIEKLKSFPSEARVKVVDLNAKAMCDIKRDPEMRLDKFQRVTGHDPHIREEWIKEVQIR